MALYTLAPVNRLSFNEIYTSSWEKGDSSIFGERMLIVNFCIHGRCDVSLAKKRYAIVKENQVCISTVMPTKNFYYPRSLYEGIQLYLDLDILHNENEHIFHTLTVMRVVKSLSISVSASLTIAICERVKYVLVFIMQNIKI